MKKYEVKVNYQPEIHDGMMAYFAQVVLITDDGEFSLFHCWEEDIDFALITCLDWADMNIGD